MCAEVLNDAKTRQIEDVNGSGQQHKKAMHLYLNQHHSADAVYVIVGNRETFDNSCLWSSVETYRYNHSGFITMFYDSSCVSEHIMLHGLGHNLGAGHKRQTGGEQPDDSFNYAHSWRDDQTGYKSVMNLVGQDPSVRVRVNYFSSPDIFWSHRGVTTTINTGTATEDNRKKIMQHYKQFASHRDESEQDNCRAKASVAFPTTTTAPVVPTTTTPKVPSQTTVAPSVREIVPFFTNGSAQQIPFVIIIMILS